MVKYIFFFNFSNKIYFKIKEKKCFIHVYSRIKKQIISFNTDLKPSRKNAKKINFYFYLHIITKSKYPPFLR